MKPSLRVDEEAVGDPTHKSLSFHSFQVNYSEDTNPPSLTLLRLGIASTIIGLERV